MDGKVQAQALEKSRAAFFADQVSPEDPPAARQSAADAQRIFWGDEDKVKGRQTQPAIPGASVYQPRVAADGIFGSTFANSMKNAHESQNRIDSEKRETLQVSQKWMPYDQARARANQM